MSRDAERLFRAGEDKFQKGDLQGARQCYELALGYDSNHIKALCQMGAIFMTRGEYDDAEPLFERALALNPDMPGPWNNLGVAFKERKRFDEARKCYERALRLDPYLVEVLSNLAVVQIIDNQFEEARKSLYQSIEIRSDYYPAYWNLASLFAIEGRVDAAMAAYDAILQVIPNHADARANRSLLTLALGDFAQGWPEFEWRFAAHPNLVRPPLAPRWLGEDLAGKTILVRAEQGLGDTFQFVRYLPWLKSLGAVVAMECQDGLSGLLSRAGLADIVLDRADIGSAPPLDFEIPLLSLPLMANTSLDTIPADIPYLVADPARAARWRDIIRNTAGGAFKIGVVWAGGPAHQNDAARSSTLEAFAPLLRIPGIAAFSLQKGEPAAQLANTPAGVNITDLGAEAQNFEDTAAIIENLDLVVSVDTSVAHLAAAMGKPVWILLAHVADWRWLLEGSETPWYPTMRLFRQTRRGGWGMLLRDVAAEAAQLADPGPSTQERLARIESIVAVGDLDEAHDLLTDLVRSAPNDVRVLNTLGVVCWSRGTTEEALKSFLLALEIDPLHRDTVMNSADVFLAFGQRADAEMICRGYLALVPDDAEILELLESAKADEISNAA